MIMNLQSEGPPRDEHNSDTKRGVASAMNLLTKKKYMVSISISISNISISIECQRPPRGLVVLE